MKVIAKAGDVSIRQIVQTDLPAISSFEYSVSITEPHGDLVRLQAMYDDNKLWGELAGAVAVQEHSTGRLLGTCQFYRSAPCIHGFEIGYVIHSQADRGKGYAGQGLRLLTDHLFAYTPTVYRHQLMIEVWNTASWKVAERAGFIREGMLRSSGFGSDDPADCFVYARTRKDYSAELNSTNGPGTPGNAAHVVV